MTEKDTLRIFERYNPAGAVTRCPNGRAHVRKQLDLYAQAAANLYGVISLTDFAGIFNSQNEDKTNGEEIFRLLLPLVLKHKSYCFYDGCIAHRWAIDGFGYADYLLREQGGKPRYVPDKEDLLKYKNEYYEGEPQRTLWRKVNDFLDKEFSDNPHRYRVFNELRGLSSQGTGLREITEILDKFDIVFRDEKQVQEFFNLLTEARNNTRLRENNGYTPDELMNLLAISRPKDHSDEIVVQERKKVGRNDPCPCGSGRKYKHCCLLTEEARTAQLTTSECALFYTTWYGLMGFINEKKKVINARIKPMYPNAVSDEQVYKVREVLWENPELITEYLAAVKLSPETTAMLESWRDRHKKGMFFVLDYKPDYAVIIDSDGNGRDRLLGIKGISRSLSDTMHRELPTQIETVLLPFKDKIIYDGFISTMPVGFAAGAKNMFGEMYGNALEYGIITQGDKL